MKMYHEWPMSVIMNPCLPCQVRNNQDFFNPCPLGNSCHHGNKFMLLGAGSFILAVPS